MLRRRKRAGTLEEIRERAVDPAYVSAGVV